MCVHCHGRVACLISRRTDPVIPLPLVPVAFVRFDRVFLLIVTFGEPVLVVEDLLSPEEIASLAERTDAIARGETGNPTEVLQIEPAVDGAELSPAERVLAVRKLFNLCDTDEPMFQHASNPKIVDVIADLLGTDDIKIYGDQLCACASSSASCQPSVHFYLARRAQSDRHAWTGFWNGVQS